MTQTKPAVHLALIAALTLFACDDGGGVPFGSDPSRIQDPAGNTPLVGVNEYDIYWALEKTRDQIAEGRKFGFQLALDTFRGYLTQAGLDATVLDGLSEASIGGPMPGGTVANQPLKADGAINSSQHALLEDKDQYYACPLGAPEQNDGTACDELIDEVLELIAPLLEEHKEQVAQIVAEQFGCLEATAMQFVEAWAQYAEEHSVEVAMIYIKHELKAAGRCDVQVNSGVVSYELGVEQGWQIVLALEARAEALVNECEKTITTIIELIEIEARSQINGFMEEHAVCLDQDVSRLNASFQAAEVQRRLGIEAGITEQINVLRTELVEVEEIAHEPGGPCYVPPPPPPGNGHQGSPLVVDVEGDFELHADGETLSSKRVSFDLLGLGESQRLSWIGPRGALLAHDIDDDGMITSGAELMGEGADCGTGHCSDGVEALARFDQPAHGGNGDGVIDRKDRAYPRLLLWQDRNGDAVSQPGELTTLEERGVRSIDLRPSYPGLQTVAGRVSSQLTLTTDSGVVQPVYDVWFRLEHQPEILSRRLPPR